MHTRWAKILSCSVASGPVDGQPGSNASRITLLCLETQYFKLIGRSVISSWVTAVGDFIRFYSVTSS